MTVIDMGYDSLLGGSWAANNTILMLQNPANDTGIITTVKIGFKAGTNGAGVKVGSFYATGGGNYTSRDYVSIGAVTAGSMQTFTGIEFDVVLDDVLGEYHTAGNLGIGGSGLPYTWYYWADVFGGSHLFYSAGGSPLMSVYAEGSTGEEGWANIAKCKGIASADMAKRRGIAVADIAKIKGAAV